MRLSQGVVPHSAPPTATKPSVRRHSVKLWAGVCATTTPRMVCVGEKSSPVK